MGEFDFFKEKKFFTTNELFERGMTYYKIQKELESGKITRLTKSTYESNEYTGDVSDFMYAMAYVPNGVVCSMSAAVYYGLTTYRPHSIDVAIRRSGKVSTLPDWPPLQLHYYQNDRLNTGITEFEENHQNIRIYDKEKTVIDIICFRNQIGIEETKEILTNYLKSEGRDLNKLYKYAKKLKCKSVLATYMEVLI